MSQTLTSHYIIEIKQLQEELKEANEEKKTELEKLKLIVSRKILVHVENFDIGHICYSLVEEIIGMILILSFFKANKSDSKGRRTEKGATR